MRVTSRARRIALALSLFIGAVISTGIVVVGGAPTIDFPSTGALLYPDNSRGLAFHCTGTLIKPNIVLTAAHCAEDGAPTQVFFQHAGFFRVAQFVPFRTSQSPATEEDIAIIVLNDSVTGITPAGFNRAKVVPVGTDSQAVGFGYHSQVTNPPGAPSTLVTLPVNAQSGLKFRGRIRTVSCANATKPIICLKYLPVYADDGSTCKGDSGGPLYAKIAGSTVVVGVTIEGKTCTFSDATQDVEVFAFRQWIDSEVQQYPPTPRADDASRHPLDPVSNRDDRLLSDSVVREHFDAQGTTPDVTVNVPAGTALLRVTVNTTPPIPDVSSAARLSLSLLQGGNATDCAPTQLYPAIICSFPHPVGGSWTFRTAGAPRQEYQLVASVF
jgi:hypothetical protein